MRAAAPVAATFAVVAATTAAAQPTTAPPSAVQVSLATEIVDLLNPRGSPAENTFVRSMKASLQALAAAHPGQFPNTIAEKTRAEDMASSFRKAQVFGWADTFDEGTLRGLLTFYRSPAGTAYLHGRASLATHTQAEIVTAAHKELRNLLDDLCKAQGCSPEKHEALRVVADRLDLAQTSNQTPPTVPHVAGVPADLISHPIFSAKPTADDLAQYYPVRALRLGLDGKVSLLCDVGAVGEVAACALLSEEPGDVGFGYAATRIASFFKLERLDRDGKAVTGRKVVIRIAFRTPKAPSAAPERKVNDGSLGKHQ